MFKFLNICVVVVVFTSTVVALASANCCFPDQWTANLVETTGEYNRDLDAASLAYGNRQFYFDYTGKQIAYLESLDNRTAHVKTQTKTIIKYNEGKKYTIISQKCKTEDISSTMESPCIPDDATLFGAHSYPAGVMAEVWFVPDKINGGSKRISVTKDDCLPLSESRITGGPDYVMRMSLYQNVTKGITDPTAFNIPASCNQLLATDDVAYVGFSIQDVSQKELVTTNCISETVRIDTRKENARSKVAQRFTSDHFNQCYINFVSVDLYHCCHNR